MRLYRSALLTTAAAAIMIAGFAAPASATKRVVAQISTDCPTDTTTTPCYGTLDAALTAAVEGDSIEIQRGTYTTANIVINKNISAVYGVETAAVILENSSGTVLTVSSITSNLNIRNLTFINSLAGVSVNNSPSVEIRNNVFRLGAGSTAIALSASSTVQIANNVFHQNATGVASVESAAINIKNNIFSSQLLAISANSLLTNIANNLFFDCAAIGPAIIFDSNDTINYKGNLRDQDPRFVDPAALDFHLLAGSPCIDKGDTSAGTDSVDGTTADMGAYGGSESDTIPFQVQGVVVTRQTASTLAVSWSPNLAYTVKSYRVYYGTTPGGYDGTGAAEGASPISVLTSTATSTTLTGLASATTPSAPAVRGTAPRNEALVLTWDAAAGATGYRIYHDTNAFTQTTLPADPVTIANTTSYTLTGLTNGVNYYTAVSAIAQKSYYVAVTALDGKQQESKKSREVASETGDTKESSAAFFSADFPEPLVPYPNLPDRKNGCFVATAAYGNYSDPVVQALRLFRDRYLMTNPAGRAFVGWYYDRSPALAAWLDAHPEAKPIARISLLPLAGLALFMTKTPASLHVIIGCFVAVVLAYLILRKRRLHKGGVL